MRKWLRWLLIALSIVLVIGLVAGGVWLATPAQPTGEAQAALQNSSMVQVTRGDWLVFEPVEALPATGYVFYPGGRVSPEAYAPYAAMVAEAGYLVVITPMPVNLAVLNAEAARSVIEAYPDIERWVVGGHSLGGAMAARFAHDNPNLVDGLVMLAAYPEASKDMSGHDLAVASIYGTLDGLATVAQVRGAASLLPPDTAFVGIEGGNHAQFGWYGPQDGDNPATISHAEQAAQTVAATLELLERAAS